MSLDLTGQPLIDRTDFPELHRAGRFGRWAEQALMMHEKGYCIITLRDFNFLAKTEAVIQAMQPLLADELLGWMQHEAGPPRLQDGWLQHDAIRSLALEPIILDALRTLYGREPFAFQTLNFAVGSQQHYHSDAVHFNSFPHGFMCGVWIALQDVEPESGPLHYFPGSHRLPYLSSRSLGLSRADVASERHPQILFEPIWQRAVDECGYGHESFLAKRGDILIWHANLLHGGQMVQDRGSRRWSQVNHYFFADCLYLTPMHSYSVADGGTAFRNPFDIRRGQCRLPPEQWRQLDPGRACSEAGLKSPNSLLTQTKIQLTRFVDAMKASWLKGSGV
jgi:hypothetical protein